MRAEKLGLKNVSKDRIAYRRCRSAEKSGEGSLDAMLPSKTNVGEGTVNDPKCHGSYIGDNQASKTPSPLFDQNNQHKKGDERQE